MGGPVCPCLSLSSIGAGRVLYRDWRHGVLHDCELGGTHGRLGPALDPPLVDRPGADRCAGLEAPEVCMSGGVSLDDVGTVMEALLRSGGKPVLLDDQERGTRQRVEADSAAAPDGLLPVFLVAGEAIWRTAMGKGLGSKSSATRGAAWLPRRGNRDEVVHGGDAVDDGGGVPGCAARRNCSARA